MAMTMLAFFSTSHVNRTHGINTLSMVDRVLPTPLNGTLTDTCSILALISDDAVSSTRLTASASTWCFLISPVIAEMMFCGTIIDCGNERVFGCVS